MREREREEREEREKGRKRGERERGRERRGKREREGREGEGRKGGWTGREDSCIVVMSAHLRNTLRECLSISSTLVRSTPGLCVEQCQARKVEGCLNCSPFRPTPFLLMEVTAS